MLAVTNVPSTHHWLTASIVHISVVLQCDYITAGGITVRIRNVETLVRLVICHESAAGRTISESVSEVGVNPSTLSWAVVVLDKPSWEVSVCEGRFDLYAKLLQKCRKRFARSVRWAVHTADSIQIIISNLSVSNRQEHQKGHSVLYLLTCKFLPIQFTWNSRLWYNMLMWVISFRTFVKRK